MEETICFTCVLTNPLGEQLSDYTQTVFNALRGIAWWGFSFGVIASAIYYGIRLVRFSMTDNPHDDPASIALEIFAAVMWGVFGLTLLLAASDAIFSVQGIWKVILEVTTGAGIDLIRDLSPDIETPEMAGNPVAKMVGLVENTLFYFIEAGFNSSEGIEDDSWIPSFHQFSTGALTFAYGLIIALLALGLIIYFSYTVVSQVVLGSFVVAFGSIFSLMAAFKLTRPMFFAGFRVMANAGFTIIAACVAVGFMLFVMNAFVEGAQCIRTAGSSAADACEAQLSMLSSMIGGVGSESAIIRLFGAVEFFASSVFLIVMAWLMLYLSQAFVSMVTGMRGAEGAIAAFSAAATGIISGGVAMAVRKGETPNNTPSGGGDDTSDDSNSDVDSDGDIADDHDGEPSNETPTQNQQEK